jgi:N-methylhydantoinase A
LDDGALPALETGFRELETEAAAWLDREAVSPERRRLARWLDLRYEGQNYELLVPAPVRLDTADALGTLRGGFLALHEDTYGFAAADEPIQVVNLRLVARGLPTVPVMPRPEPRDASGATALVDRRVVDFAEAGGPLDCPVYDRARLPAGQRLGGPAVLEQFDSTTLVYPGQAAHVDAHGLVRIEEG